MFTDFLKSHFAPAFFFLPRERRQALQCLYSLCRVLDDIVDKPEDSPAELLSSWKKVFQHSDVEPVAGGKHEGLAREALRVIKIYDIPLFSILELIDGVGSDLVVNRFLTPLDTERYCYGVASTVGIACLPVFGVPWEHAKEYAVRLGIAIQWVNIIRDIATDAKINRIYLPQDHLEQFGCRETDILERKDTPAFRSLITYEGHVARAHFKRAEELLPLTYKKELLPARIMGKIYIKLLEKLERQSYPVIQKRVSLNLFEKISSTIGTIRE